MAPKPPVFTHTDSTGMTFTVIGREDVAEFYGGRHDLYSFPLDSRMLVKLAWWVVWDWWIKYTLCGWRTRKLLASAKHG